jgi:hypothetical protein
MNTVSWPTAILYVVLVICATYLIRTGVIPSQGFYLIVGALLGHTVSKSSSALRLGLRRSEPPPPLGRADDEEPKSG